MGFWPIGRFLAGEPYRLPAAGDAKHAVARDLDGCRTAAGGVQGCRGWNRPAPNHGSAGIWIPSAR